MAASPPFGNTIMSAGPKPPSRVSAWTTLGARQAPDAQAQARLVRYLRATTARGAGALAAVLESCTARSPCQSGACLRCGRDLQRAHARLVEEAIRTPARALRNRASLITLVPASACVEPGALTAQLLGSVRSQVAEAAMAAGLGPTVFGLDISYNVDLQGETDPYWMPHSHGTGLDWLSEAQNTKLRDDFPASGPIRRPVDVRELDGRPNGPEYAAKPDRFQRESYVNPGKPGAERGPYRDTRYHALRVEQAVELALVEHEVGLRARVITHGIADEVVERHLGGFNWARDGP